MAPSFHPSLRSDVTADGQRLGLGPCLAHLATLGGQTGGQGPTSAAGLRVPGRWGATTHPLGVHLSRETVRRFQARAKVRLSVRGSRRPASARHVVRSAGSLSGSLGPSVPPPARPQPLWALRLVAYGCHSALPAGATRRAGAAALRCERIKTSPGVWAQLRFPATPLARGAPANRLRSTRFPLPGQFGESGFAVQLGVVPAPPAFLPFQKARFAQPRPFSPS